jgi:fatty acid desaturase
VFAPALIATQYARPDLVPYLSWLSFYFAVSAAVVAHNHNHCPTFANKRANAWFGGWVSFLYGYPTFAWIPTHNLNHHKHVNKPGDATITWRFSNRHNFLVASTYFFVSAYYQSAPTDQFVKRAKASNPALFRMITWQIRTWAALNLIALSTALLLHGFKTGLYVWAFSVALPAVFALWTVHLFNYEQHVHTDPWSKYDHSRNFVGPVLNFLLFNNGYHTAHHEHAGSHWSLLPKLDAALAPHMHPSLRQKSLWWYWLKQYLLAPLFPSLGTKQLGRAPFDTGSTLDLTSDSVDAVVENAGRV